MRRFSQAKAKPFALTCGERPYRPGRDACPASFPATRLSASLTSPVATQRALHHLVCPLVIVIELIAQQ